MSVKLFPHLRQFLELWLKLYVHPANMLDALDAIVPLSDCVERKSCRWNFLYS